MTEQTPTTAPAAALTVETARESNMLYIMDNLDPVAMSGTTNERFAGRLGEQVASCQMIPAKATAMRAAELATSAVATLKALAPANAIEAMIATQAVAAHNAGLDLLQLAVNEKRRKLADSYARQHARLANVTLRSLDQLVRLRGRQRQTIRIEHVRMSEDGKVTVRQEEERTRG